MPEKISKPRRIARELSVGEVAERSGLPVSTIHFYEGKGLVSSWRTPANHRRFNRAVLRRIAIIRVAQRAGVPLREIAAHLDPLPAEGGGTAAEWARIAAAWRADLEERITCLTRLRDQLDGCIGCGCLSIRDCPLRNPYDRLAERGPGAHFPDETEQSSMRQE